LRKVIDKNSCELREREKAKTRKIRCEKEKKIESEVARKGRKTVASCKKEQGQESGASDFKGDDLDSIDEQALVIGKAVDLAEKNDDIEVLWLYGSRAKGCATKESDYDFAVAFKNFELSVSDKYLRPNLLAMDWAALLNIEESKLSVVDINAAPAYLGFNIVEYGEALYQEPSMRRVVEMNRIYSQYDFQLLESQLIESRLSEEKLKEVEINE
jgi:predicted nucleotidyltransferase